MNRTPEVSRRDALTARRVLALLALAACVTAVVPLMLQGSVEQARRRLAEELYQRFGITLSAGDTRFVIPREAVLWDIRLSRENPERGPAVKIEADELRLQPDLTALLSGQPSFGRVIIRGGRFEITLPELAAGTSRSPTPAQDSQTAPHSLQAILASAYQQLPDLPNLPFRLSLYGCTLQIAGLPVPGGTVEMDDLEADLHQPPDSMDRYLRISARVTVAGIELPLTCRIRAAGKQDASMDLDIDPVDLGRLAFLVADHVPGWRPGGTGHLQVELETDRNCPARARLKAEFQGIPLPPAVSGVLDPLTGTLELEAALQSDFSGVDLHGASRSNALDAAGEGTIRLDRDEPEITGAIRADALPLEPLIRMGLALAPPALSDLTLEPDGPARVAAFVSGSLLDPRVSVEAYLAGAHAQYTSGDPKMPSGRVRFGQMLLRWTRGQRFPEGMVSVLDGGLEKPFMSFRLDGVTATVMLEQGRLALKPFSARLNEQPLFGDLTADLNALTADISAVVTLKDIEKTPLGHPSADLWLSGEAKLRAKGRLSPKRIELTASAEATQSGIGLEWWLRKPAGVGAAIHEARLTLEPEKQLKVEGRASVDATPVNALLEYDWEKNERTWQVKHIRVDLPYLDVNSAGKCFNLPYTITGTYAKDAYYERNRRGETKDGNVMEIGGYIDRASLLPEGCPVPLICEGAKVRVVLDNRREDLQFGEVTIETQRADVPPLTETWMLPLDMKADPAYLASQEPGPPRLWTYHLAAAAVYMPPWAGENFSAVVQDTPETVSMEPFRAEVEGGKIEGYYSKVKETNEMRLRASWERLPVVYLLRHLELPEVLEGRVDGRVDYTMDTDDPGTLSGKGSFSVQNGRFFSDALIAYFGPAFLGTVSDLHPSELAFREFRSEVGLSGDRIRTDNIRLDLEGMSFTGSGTWITGGDIDYEVMMSVQPDTAEQIPIMKQSFNIEGFRLAQRTIDLGFRIRGPAFKPVSEISGLPPIGVTLVSGAAEMTGEAVRIFDLPRQLLFSLFKAGGGVIEATRQNLPSGPLRRKQNVGR